MLSLWCGRHWAFSLFVVAADWRILIALCAAAEFQGVRPMITSEADPIVAVKRSVLGIVHFDAEWDGHRPAMAKKLLAGVEACQHPVAVQYVDDHPDIARSRGLLNVPSLAYYRDGECVAVVIGLAQDVPENLELLRAGTGPRGPRPNQP